MPKTITKKAPAKRSARSIAATETAHKIRDSLAIAIDLYPVRNQLREDHTTARF